MDNDHRGVVPAQENSEEQAQDFHLYIFAPHFHLFTRSFVRSPEHVLEQQQPAVFYGWDIATRDDVHRRGCSETNFILGEIVSSR